MDAREKAKKNDPYYLEYVKYIKREDYYDSDYHDARFYQKRPFYVNLFRDKVERKKTTIDYGTYNLFCSPSEIDEPESEYDGIPLLFCDEIK
jgi:hypothetical protein